MENNTPQHNQAPAAPIRHDISGRNAFKIGCMVALGIAFAGIVIFSLIFGGCAACTIGTVGVGIATVEEANRQIEDQRASETLAAQRAQSAATPTPTPTPTPLTHQQATAIYQNAASEGIVISYDQASETIRINETAWILKPQEYHREFIRACETLIQKPFTIVNNYDGRQIHPNPNRP